MSKNDTSIFLDIDAFKTIYRNIDILIDLKLLPLIQWAVHRLFYRHTLSDPIAVSVCAKSSAVFSHKLRFYTKVYYKRMQTSFCPEN